MKSVWRDIVTAFFMGMLIPFFLLNTAVTMKEKREEPAPETVPLPVSTGIEIMMRSGESTVPVDMEQYLIGVVLAEMPASFEPEALKAQAVAARTYTARAMETGGKHGDGSVCTDSTCCQAYITEEIYLSRGGIQADLDRVRSAVWSTAGQVLSYEGELIEATYFSCSGGRTEDAVEVWGQEYPYLISVESPGEEAAAHYRDTLVLTPEELAAALDRELTGPVKDWFGRISYTEAGSAAIVTICGEEYTGTELRALLGLRSAAFSVETTENSITITTKGYGHRVGMSQYGADAMAAGGSGYGEILAHYYPGTALVRLGIDENGEIVYHN